MKRQWELNRNIFALEDYMRELLRFNQLPNPAQIAAMYYEIVESIVAGALTELPNIRIAVDSAPYISEYEQYLPGPRFELRIANEHGEVSTFVRLSLNVINKTFWIQNPDNIYRVDPTFLDYFNLQFLDTFGAVGWHHRGSLRALLFDIYYPQ